MSERIIRTKRAEEVEMRARVSICTFVLVKQVNLVASAPRRWRCARGMTRSSSRVRQYLYFCTSKASKLSGKRAEKVEMRARYDALVVEIARQEKRLKQRIGSLDRSKRAAEQVLTGFTTQFTCFTSTKVPILRLKQRIGGLNLYITTQFICFTSTKVQILTPESG